MKTMNSIRTQHKSVVSILSATLALAAVSACLLFAPKSTQASNGGNGGDPNHIPQPRPLPDLVITNVAPVRNYIGKMKGSMTIPNQLWVKVENHGDADSGSTVLLLAWGSKIWPSEETDPDTDHEAVPPIQAGGYQWIKVYTDGYDLWSKDTYYFLQVNRQQYIAESNYQNNTYYSAQH